MFFFKKERKVIEKIRAYVEEIDVCRYHFLEAVLVFVSQDTFSPQTDMVDLVHHAESRADDLRREIEYELYNKALIPESREDVLFLLEALDSIPNCFQDLCYNFSCQKMIVPRELKEDILMFIRKNLEAYAEVRSALEGFFTRSAIIGQIKRTDDIESETDVIERKLISKIFDLAIDKADRILYKSLVEKIASISDRAQDVADHLTIALIKRRI